MFAVMDARRDVLVRVRIESRVAFAAPTDLVPNTWYIYSNLPPYVERMPIMLMERCFQTGRNPITRRKCCCHLRDSPFYAMATVILHNAKSIIKE